MPVLLDPSGPYGYVYAMKKLAHTQCLYAMEHGDFPPEVRESARDVAVVLTQSWCPQWDWMKAYLHNLAQPDTDVWYVEYDRESFFGEFMAFKERVLGNDLVPYVRYYRDGVFHREGNYSGSSQFLSLLTGAGNKPLNHGSSSGS